MPVRIKMKPHGGGHTWRLKSAKGACQSCLLATGRVLALKMTWECTVAGCKATKKTKHKHVV